MQKDQIARTKELIEDLNNLKIGELIFQAYPAQDEVENTVIKKLSISQFISLSNHIISQFAQVLEDVDSIILPATFNSVDYGQADVPNQLNKFFTYIQSQNFVQAEQVLIWLAQYQMQFGPFKALKNKHVEIDYENLGKAFDIIELQKEKIKSYAKQYSILIKDLSKQKQELIDFQDRKQTEFRQITNNLETSNSTTNQIQVLLTNATQSETKAKSILDQIQSDKQKTENTAEDLERSSSKIKHEFTDLFEKLNGTWVDFNKLHIEFETKLKFIENKSSYFEERNTYLDSLIGREVGASLFETFKQRKTELIRPLIFWRFAVGTMGLLTFLAIFAIFTNFFGFLGEFEKTLKWENIFVNTLKSSPFFFLLYYTISQYNKERNFQEEYAFKSAVALTIKAYADVLKDDINKDALILKAVYGVYRSPLNENGRTNKEVNSGLDMAHDILTKGSEILTKNSKPH